MSDTRAMNFEMERADLPTVIAEGRLVAAEIERVFGRLSAAQLNWKPAEGEWSIAQCVEHLLVSNAPFLPILEAIGRGTYSPGPWARVPGLPGIFGKLLIRTLRPGSGRDVKARAKFQPSASAIDPAILGAFAAQQARLLGLMEAARARDLERIVVISPVAAVVTYRALDGCRIVVAHEHNHVVQARRVLDSPGFPS